MTKKLSDSFFGDKRINRRTYQHLQDQGELCHQDIRLLFEPYTSQLAELRSRDSQCSLLDLFVEFLQEVVVRFQEWQFQKFSSAVEIAAHVFEHSFEFWLSKQQSFKYFSQVAVRHSLFRPPHSVCVFNYEELSELTLFWTNHFHRYYDYYQECMSSSLNEVLGVQCLPPGPPAEGDLRAARPGDKAEVLRQLQS